MLITRFPLNQKGMATIEVIPVLMIFILLFNFTLGFFGVIHTGILNSIAARNYAFETFRNRATLNYLRDIDLDSGTDQIVYKVGGNRFHGIVSETRKASEDWPVTIRPIRFTDVRSGVEELKGKNNSAHQATRKIASNSKVSEISAVDEGVNPVWIRSLYGICINVKCGD